jgi:hypothetical protein
LNFKPIVAAGKKMCPLLALACCLCSAAGVASAAELSSDAKGAIPENVQQLIVIDYDAMQNSSAAMDLKNQVMPPELKRLEKALSASGMDDNNDVDELAFASFRPDPNREGSMIIGIAQGQFSEADVIAGLKKHKLKPKMLRTNQIWPMVGSGMVVCFVSPTTMIFGDSEAMKFALNARDGFAPSMLKNTALMQQVGLVDNEPLWSVLDGKGTQLMMRNVLGQASQLADYESVKKSLISSRYSMNFNNGVKFDLAVVTPDTFTAATMSSMMNAAAMYEKMTSTPIEKTAIDATDISSNSGTLLVNFNASDYQFESLLHSSLFQTVVH